MSIKRSSNCSAYTDTISLLIDGTASVLGKEEICQIDLPPMFSCQTSAYEAPDDVTLKELQAAAEVQMDAKPECRGQVVVDTHTNIMGTRSMEYSAAQLSSMGLASNCYRGDNDLNDATHMARAVCSNMYDMTDAKGRSVRDTNKQFTSALATCDVSDEAMPQLMEDLRKVAAHHSTEHGLRIHRDIDLACTVSILPRL